MHIKGFDPYEFSKKIIGGVPVYYKNLPWSPCIHINFQFKTGAFADPLGKEGLAHLLEHLIGNGSPMLPDKKAIRDFSRLYMLNSRNARTSYEWTDYIGKCLPENFQKVFSTITDYVFHPFLRAEDVEHERKVVTQEAWGRYKNDRYLNFIKEYCYIMYHGHQRERIYSPLGWPDTIQNITQKDVLDFHNKNYVKENLSIFLVGAIEESDIESIEAYINAIPSGVVSDINKGKLGKPREMRVEKTGDEIGDPREQATFAIMRVNNGISPEEDTISAMARMLLHDVLFERLRLEHSLCYGLSISRDLRKDFFEFDISVNTSVDKLAIVEEQVWKVINEVIEVKWKDRFKDVHKMIIDQIRSSETMSDHVIETGANQISVYGRTFSLQEDLEEAEKVTYEDIAHFVKNIFDPEQVLTEIILPSKK